MVWVSYTEISLRWVNQGDECARVLMVDKPQRNVLITRDGQACLGEYGVIGAFPVLYASACDLETLRFMAPERHPQDALAEREIGGPSIESDIYSLAMISFFVRSPVVDHPHH